MKKETFNNELFECIKKSTCSFTCIEFIKNKLLKEDFYELYENDADELVGYDGFAAFFQTNLQHYQTCCK